MPGIGSAMLHRRRLLDEAYGLLDEPGITIAPDQFPIVTGRITDGRQVRIELIADTMVTRRLPQLWLKVTLFEREARMAIWHWARWPVRPAPNIIRSCMVSPNGWHRPRREFHLLMRGDGRATAEQSVAVGKHFQKLFADPQGQGGGDHFQGDAGDLPGIARRPRRTHVSPPGPVFAGHGSCRDNRARDCTGR